MLVEIVRPLTEARDELDPPLSQRPKSISGGGYLKFRNDRGVPEICIGVREFECIGVSPPQDHPHIYIDMGGADTIHCPYCGTRFRFDPRLTPLEVDPSDSFFVEITRSDQFDAVTEPRTSSKWQTTQSM